MRIVFIGSTKFGLVCLKTILSLSFCKIVGIITNPKKFSISYRPEGVTNFQHANYQAVADEHGIPLLVMEGKMNDPLIVQRIKKWEPNFILVAGWYHMIPKVIRAIAPTAGLHASLLPNYSGGAPLVWAIINGEQQTGISFFMLSDGVDNGDIIGQRPISIFLNDTIATLYARIEQAGIEILLEKLPELANSRAQLTPQDERKRRVMPQRRPEDGEIHWHWNALRIYNFIRAQTKPYPGAFTFFNKEKFFIWEAKLFDYLPATALHCPLQGGEVMGIVNTGPLQGILVATAKGDHPILLTVVGSDDINSLSVLNFAKEKKIERGHVLGKRIK